MNPDEKSEVNIILGDGVKKIQTNEYLTINSQKKSLYAKKLIKKGEKFSQENIVIKGPAGGLMPKFINIILNRNSITKLESGQTTLAHILMNQIFKTIKNIIN